MQPLYYELGVLAKAVHFKNLSAAAMHVGLSQSQLSRIIGKIEDELKLVVLDRAAKRKSGWTPLAFSLAEIFDKSVKRLTAEIRAASNEEMVAEINIGTLEGLSAPAMKTARACFEQLGVRRVCLDIFDLSELESNFLSGNLDLIFTSKIPGRYKSKYLEEIGYQHLEKITSNTKFALFSTFEYGRSQKKEVEGFKHVLVSNSLAIKKEWLRTIGGSGILPSEPRKGKAKDQEPVLLIGSELLSPVVWDKITASLAIE